MARAFRAAEAADASRVLLVSPRSGDGKTHFASCVLRHASVVTDVPFQVKPFEAVDPHAQVAFHLQKYVDGYVWVDGLALLEGRGPLALTPAVRTYFDGVLLVARGMVTTRDEVAQCAEQLGSLGMKVFGAIWNEFDCPPIPEAVQRIKKGLWSWPPRFPAGVYTGPVRRSQ